MRECRLIAFLLFFGLSGLLAQSKAQLEKERKKIIKDIEKTQSYLSTTQKNKQTALKDLRAIETQVHNRKKLIGTIKLELEKSNELLIINKNKIDSIKSVLVALNQQYVKILRYDYLQKLSNNKWSYLLSSDNLNTFVLRWRYINQFDDFCKKKKEEIASLNTLINNSNIEISKTKVETENLLSLEQTSFSTLEKDLGKKNEILKSLTGKEEQLKKELNDKKSKREKLNNSIENIILKQLKEAAEKEKAERQKREKEKERAREKTVIETGDNKSNAINKEKELPTETELLSTEFSNNKGKLPWPIARGDVSSRFGNHPHPQLKGVMVPNNGIDITGSGTLNVKSVADGKVVGVTKVLDSDYMIILQHGSYFTVYSNITDVSVRTGQVVNAAQQLGTISPDETNTAELHFEVWKDKTKLNPEKWLK